MSLTRPDDFEVETARPLIPEARAKRGASGVPMTIGDHSWFLAWGTTARTLDDLRDRIFDSMTVRRSVAIPDVLQVAWVLLAANYDLTESEVAALVTTTEERELVDSVLDALFGPERPRRSHADWMRASLLANGIDPDRVPPGDVPAILDLLVQCGKAPGTANYIASAAAVRDNAEWRRLAASSARPKPKVAESPQSP